MPATPDTHRRERLVHQIIVFDRLAHGRIENLLLDRSVDDERVASIAASELSEVMNRVHALLPNRREEAARFLEGLPRRYLLTRTPDQIRTHVEMAAQIQSASGEENAGQVELRYAPGLSELTLITRDRPMLFASMAGALAAWGMNIVTADSDRSIEVLGTAGDAYGARAKIKALNPDVLTLDVEMPKMDGVTFLKNLMRLRPMPVVMISSLTEHGAEITLDALAAGAVDYLPKPKIDIAATLAGYRAELIAKVKVAASTRVRALNARRLEPMLSHGTEAVLPTSTPVRRSLMRDWSST